MEIGENDVIIPMVLASIPRQMVDAELRRTDFVGKLARHSHLEYVDVSDDEQQRQRDWTERFRSVMAEGEANDWLQYDYDADPEPIEIRTRKATTVYDESEEDHAARVLPYIESLRGGMT